MATDKHQQVESSVLELIDRERQLHAGLDRQLRRLAEHGDVSDATRLVEGARDAAERHRTALAQYLAAPTSAAEPRSHAAFFAEPLSTTSATLRTGFSALSELIADYLALFEISLKLYEPRLREIAPAHLREYATIAHAMLDAIPPVVAGELARDGLECQCVCPMCGLGVCGCVDFARQTAGTVLQEAARPPADGDGFALQAPKAGSGLALAGVQRGDRLLAIDDQPVRSNPEIQGAIRKHAIGEEVRLTVQSIGGPPREIRVRHASDYPKP